MRDFALIAQARDILLDTKLRNSYDKWLAAHIPISFENFLKKEKELSSATHFAFEEKKSECLQTQQVKSWKRGNPSQNVSLLSQFRNQKL